MERRKFGNSGIDVSILGYGAGHIGAESLDEKESEKILNRVVDMGINLIDTARGYGLSEERIGKYLSHRRSEIVIATKVGYGVEGYQDWTYDCVREGIDRALRVMKTDYIDIVNLHSCPKETLERYDVIKALLDARDAGKIRVAGYSGENDELWHAVEYGQFQGVECSVNICDQKSIDGQIARAKERGIGVIAKRPIANGPWRYATQPFGNYCEEYWKRMKKMNLPNFGYDFDELFLRFTLSTQGVSSAIAGSINIEHIKRNVEIANKGALGEEIYSEIRRIFNQNEENWRGEI